MKCWNQGFCGAMGNYKFEHLNSINLKHYNQTCSNDHLCKTTNAESAHGTIIQTRITCKKIPFINIDFGMALK